MVDTSRIREHMEVVGKDGQHVGTVDHLEDGEQRVKLAKSDPAAGGEHHWINIDEIESVDDRIHLR